MLKAIRIIECASCDDFCSRRHIIIRTEITHGICNKGLSVLCEKNSVNSFVILVPRLNIKFRQPAAAAENRRSEAGKRCGNCELEQAAVRKSRIADICKSLRQSYVFKIFVAEKHTVRNTGKTFSYYRIEKSVAI